MADSQHFGAQIHIGGSLRKKVTPAEIQVHLKIVSLHVIYCHGTVNSLNPMTHSTEFVSVGFWASSPGDNAIS